MSEFITTPISLGESALRSSPFRESPLVKGASKMKKLYQVLAVLCTMFTMLAVFKPSQVTAENQYDLEIEVKDQTTFTLWELGQQFEKVDDLDQLSVGQLDQEFESKQESGSKTILFEGLTPGYYYGRQTDKTASSYQYESFLVYLGDQTTNQKLTVRPKYQVETGQVKLTKYGLAKGESSPLSGVVFRLFEEGTDRPFSVHQGQATTNQEGHYELKTDDNGQITVGNLLPGDYYFVEIQSQPGYEFTSEPIQFSVTANQETTVELTNTYKEVGHMQFKKVSPRGEGLKGASFRVLDRNKQPVKVDGQEYIVESNAQGYFRVMNLDYGTYYLEEVEPPKGYQLLDKLVPFEISKDSYQRDMALSVENQPSEELSSSQGSDDEQPDDKENAGDSSTEDIVDSGSSSGQISVGGPSESDQETDQGATIPLLPQTSSQTRRWILILAVILFLIGLYLILFGRERKENEEEIK